MGAYPLAEDADLDSEPAASNDELAAVLAGWGVTVNKDLALDLGGLGQIFGFGPEIPVVLQYESHPITEPLARVPTAFPLTRSLDTKSEDKTSVSKLVATGEDSLATTEIGPGGAVDLKKGKKGPLTLMAAGTYSGAKQGRFVHRCTIADGFYVAQGVGLAVRRLAIIDVKGGAPADQTKMDRSRSVLWRML